MEFKFFLLILPASALGQIYINLNGSFTNDPSDLNLYFSGYDSGIITDTEQDTFGLKYNDLMNAVKICEGKMPDNVYLHSPTPWGDLYKTYRWYQVRRASYPQRASIIDSSSVTAYVIYQIFENNSPRQATFSLSVSRQIYNEVSISWTKDGELTLSDNIQYEIDLNVPGRTGAISFNYSTTWGENIQGWPTVTVGSLLPLEIVLDTSQSVAAELTATKGTVQMEIEYEAKLDGWIAVNYADTYKGSHFHAVELKPCMNTAKIRNQKMSEEVINITVHTNSKLAVYDNREPGTLMEIVF